MPLVAYDPSKYNIDAFVNKCTTKFQTQGYYLTNVGLITHAPGVMFALDHVETMDEAELHKLKSYFYENDAKSVTTELNTMNHKIYFQVYLPNAQKPHMFSNIYKLIPPLPVVFISILCLYEMNKMFL